MFDRKLRNEQQDSWIKDDFFREAAYIEQEAQAVVLEENLMDKGQMLLGILEKAQEDNFSSRSRYDKRSPAVLVKWAAMIMVTLAGIFGMTMTSQANRTRFLHTIERMFNGNSAITLENSNERYVYDDSGMEAIDDIRDQLGCSMPIFFYSPEEMVFKGYSIDLKTGTGLVEYIYNKKTITLCVYSNGKDSTRSQLVDSIGEKKQQLDVNGTEFTIRKEEETPTSIYSAHWIWGESYYEIRGGISQEQMCDIVKGIRIS